MSTNMPTGITRSYAHAFTTMICEAAAKALTIKELKDLDDAEVTERTEEAA